MIHYAIRHYVTTDETTDGMDTSTVHGDDALCVWTDGDPTSDPPDVTHEVPAEGWRWQSDTEDWQKHPAPLTEYASSPSEIVRVSPWETTITDGVSD